MQRYNVIIERNGMSNGYSKRLVSIAKKNNVNLEAFFQNYKGIEGFTASMKTMYSVSLCIDQVREVSINCYGFDVGIFDIDCYSFSSIYNEIIFSSHNFFLRIRTDLIIFFFFQLILMLLIFYSITKK